MAQLTDEEIISTADEHLAIDCVAGNCPELNVQSVREFARAIIAAHEAKLAAECVPVYAFRRKGLDDFCTCDERRYLELKGKPNLFEVRVLYTHPQQDARDAERAMDLLAAMFDKWENGTPCHEDDGGGDFGAFIGNAFQLSDEEFHEIADLLNKHRPVDAAIAAKGGA